MAEVRKIGAMNIVILWPGDFPHGMALENQFTAFAKGLIGHGENVIVFCPSPAWRSQAPAELSLSGVYQGIAYSFTGGQLFYSKIRIFRVVQRLIGFMGGLCEMWKHKRRNRLDAVLFSLRPSWQMVLLVLFGKIYGVKTVHVRSEHPFYNVKDNLLKIVEAYIQFKVLVRFYDGLVLISQALVDLYRPQMGHRARFLLLPANVDMERFERSADSRRSPISGQYIAWCGSVWGFKDGVCQLVEAFMQITESHPDVKLALIAPIDESPDYIRVRQMICNSAFCDRIVITGRVPYADIPDYLSNAVVLTLARPSSLQAEYGFPTKLPEYLSTGKPVLATRVGDIPRYLKDGENAYLVDPDDIGGFAEKLSYILYHPDEALRVGAKGKMLAQAEFSYQIQASKIVAFLHELQGSNTHFIGS